MIKVHQVSETNRRLKKAPTNYQAKYITLSSFSHGAVFPSSGSGNVAYRVLPLNLGFVNPRLSRGQILHFYLPIYPAVNCDKLDVTSSCFSFGP